MSATAGRVLGWGKEENNAMRFSDSLWSQFESVQGSFCNRLPQPSTVRFASILWADARSCGLSQHRLDVWGIIAPLRPGEAPATPVPLSSLPPINKTLVLIGERVYEGGNFPPFAYRSPSGEMLFLHPRHIALKLPNNPLVLDMLWLHGHEPEINIQIPFGNNTLTTTQLAKYSGDLCKQMPLITQYLIPKGGRPKGSGEIETTERKSLDKAYLKIEKRVSWSSAEVGRITNASENTVLQWRKNLLREVIPKINQLLQKSFSKEQIADQLETTPTLIDLYIEDAKKLRIN